MRIVFFATLGAIVAASILYATVVQGAGDQPAQAVSTETSDPAHASGQAHTPGQAPSGGRSAAELALAELVLGNARHVVARHEHPDQTTERRREVAVAQHPIAVVVGCADSRVPPEIVFDQGLGDLFVVRCAGEVVDAAALGSIEYAVDHLGVALIVVLGHERCGAVKAVLDGGETHGHVTDLLRAIRPAVEAVRGMPGDALDNAVRAQIAVVKGQIEESEPLLAGLAREDAISVVGARYDLDSGEVDFLGSALADLR
jgi:carbonic anhydrase